MVEVKKPQNKPEEKKEEQIKQIVIPEVLTIKELADKMKIVPSVIIKKLFMQGKVATVNQEIDYETAEEIALEFDVLCEKEEVVDVIEELLKEEEEDENDENEKNKAIVGDEAEEDNFERILGDSYETVGIKNASAAAFVTSAMELGLTDVAVLSAVEVEEIPHWQISKSKKATNLDENFESQVTLSLPSAEEKLENDIVFVLDKSTSVQLENEALEMLKELQAQAKKNGAKVKVGVVIFNKEAHKSDFMDLETQYDAMRIRNGVRHGMRLMSNARAIAPKVASTPSNPVMLMNAALRWMPNFSHPGMDRIMQATGRRNIGRYRLAAMRSCRQLHRQYTANSAGLIGDQNGAYRPSVVPSTGRKAMASNSQMTLRSCDVRNRRHVLLSAMMVARVDGVVAYACLVHVILPPRQPYSFIMMRGRGMLSPLKVQWPEH